MKQAYQIVDHRDSRGPVEFLGGEGSVLVLRLHLIENTELAVDDLIAIAGRATLEAVLTLSAEQGASAL